ncbi:baseplate J/gp47 family protein [Megasphaera elsdenii]|uniref:Baseplate J/gp47 family protein n=1 Tax=Megasphaera elsdenii TaxID=907 RepID=A0A848ESS5_MEGEL|nr:baseplate J/gp47 family protein [Megasphaera elsdenii]NMK40051.1 baseplate J/gp47 family protein [Megasphaera elsdenii]
MYEAREQDEILTELQQNVGNDASSYEGTFTYDVLAANSIEFAKQEVEREQAYKAMFARTSWGEYLEMRAEEHGIFRRQAVKAKGTVTVSGNGTVPQGSVFQTFTGIAFYTTKAASITQSGDIPVECSTAGTIGNVKAGTITVIPMSIPGISSVMNADATYDGFDEEDDATLYNRLIFKVRQPATSGNVNDYIEWATSIAGVGHVTVVPLWNGNGTVKVIIADSSGSPASSNLLKQVSTTIETKRPIGATVSVVAPAILELHIALTPTKGKGDADAIKTLLNNYFTSRNFSGGKVSYAVVGKMIIDDESTNVTDYDSLTINGDVKNISLTDEQIPKVTEVTLNG